MPKFETGDQVVMPGVPIHITVLEVGACDDEDCEWGGETVRFTDPGGNGEDWEHAALFERAGA